MNVRCRFCLTIAIGILLATEPLRAAEDTILHTVIDGAEIDVWIPAGVKTLRGAVIRWTSLGIRQ